MSLEQYAYISQIVGVILVIASLAYVARQLRQSTEMLRIGASSEWLQKDFDIVNSLIESRELAEVWVKGGNEFHQLDETDRQRLIFFERRAFTLWNHLFQLRQKTLYEDSDWEAMQLLIRQLGSRQSVQEAWRVFRGTYDQGFREFLDSRLSLAAGRPMQERTS